MDLSIASLESYNPTKILFNLSRVNTSFSLLVEYGGEIDKVFRERF